VVDRRGDPDAPAVAARAAGPLASLGDTLENGAQARIVQMAKSKVERVGGRSIRYRAADYRTAYQMMLALLVMAIPAAYQYPRP